MRLSSVVAVLVVLLLVAASAAEGRVVSDRKGGELPTPALLIEPKNPKPPRIEVVAQPAYRVKIAIDMHCTRGEEDRRSNRRIRVKPPFSRRFGLPMSNPDRCTIFVLATYADESENANGESKRGNMTLRIYR